MIMDLGDSRMAICRECPLFGYNDMGSPLCDSHK